MMNIRKQIKIYLILMFIFLSGIVFFLSNEFLEPYISDFYTSNIIKKSQKQKDISSKNIVLIVIDEESLNQIRWPWPRNYYSKMFDFLENYAGAKLILFDAVVTSPDPYTENTDLEFYKYLKTAKKLILGFDLCKGNKTSSPCKAIQKNLYPVLNEKIKVNIEQKGNFKPDTNSYTGIMYMQPGFLESANSLGTVIVMDRELNKITNDRTIRTYCNTVYFNNKYYPSLALTGYSNISGEKDFIITKKTLSSESGKLEIKFPHSAVKTQSNYMYLKWYKPYNNSPYYTHKAYSAIDILNLYDSIKSGKGDSVKSTSGEVLSPEVFKDKIIFVGSNASAQSLDDKLGSPILVNHAGVDIQATALNNYLDNQYTKKADFLTNIIITSLILLLSFALIYNTSAVASLATNFFIIFVYYIIYVKCLENDFILNFITIFLLEILLFAFSYIYKFTIEGEKKDKIQKAMGKYLSYDVMKKVVSNIDSIELGGRKTEATIMFIDIRKFTTISEKMDADEVSNLLNEYFTTIYPIITYNNGILNKFIGDAVLAIFEGKYHAQNAIICANEVLLSVKELQQKWIREGKPKIDVGVGINSGEVFIGNIGTKDRMEYTVIGDTVNTASRIEGYNKIYKTKFLIGEYTYELVKNMVAVIKINKVALRGKRQKINIYEILKVYK